MEWNEPNIHIVSGTENSGTFQSQTQKRSTVVLLESWCGGTFGKNRAVRDAGGVHAVRITLKGYNYFTEMCSSFEAGSYLRLMDVCITQL